MSVRLVDRPEAFDALMREVAGAEIVALDTEAASFHRYHDRIYLIQLSTPVLTAVIDPLGVGDLTPIAALLTNGAVEKVFHDADYDLRLFDKQLGFHAKRLFDTRIAAQFLNEPGIGLGALLEKYFNVKADKRFQRADWSSRPLSAAMLDYAAGDTQNLCELRNILRTKLEQCDRLSWVEEEFELLEKTRWTAPSADPTQDYLRMKGARALDRRSLAILRELQTWRAATASQADRAEFRVAGNEVLFHLAQHPVANMDALAAVKGIGRDMLDRRGPEVLAAIGRGLAVPEDQLPRIARLPRRAADPVYEARLEALKKVRNAIAERLTLAPGVLCPNGTLEAVARTAPESLAALEQVDGVRRWQMKTFGLELLAAVHAGDTPAPAAAVTGVIEHGSGPVSADVARKALRAVKDPELGLNIIDIGLVYDVTVTADGVAHVKMTLTSPGCPAGAEIMGDVKQTLMDLEGITDVDLELVWEPYWTPEKMDPRVRAFLGH